ncbi:hypothetical protein K458DRAFT_330724 [Lentithecium fluviatile CBS 122367]|uniref:Uncharacterized protein n=1 Tax=Lentithecium fluviatile CBS 122367 TaxID=1168545 RepID=A0A6G1JCW0_9PLEO|nr:hypothetical protein K458DRAFT_330724 [Lentithecium fluviatile CBS 122367]
MTTGQMRRLFSSSSRARLSRCASTHLTTPRMLGLKQYQRTITDVRPRQASVARTWFTSSSALLYPEGSGDHPPPDERKLKLGKTIRILHDRLPTLLVSPLPQDVLSPQITLHLFPSTHPHLPTVSGKIAYTAALWTAPVAWGRVPVVGNVKLKILSERMVKKGGACSSDDSQNEQLIVKWETCGKSKEKDHGQVSEAFEKITSIVGRSREEHEEFSGLFLFEFDEEGRIVKHTIEHVEESGQSDKPAKVISVTDWLLGRAWRREEGSPGLAFVKRTKSSQTPRTSGNQ